MIYNFKVVYENGGGCVFNGASFHGHVVGSLYSIFDRLLDREDKILYIYNCVIHIPNSSETVTPDLAILLDLETPHDKENIYGAPEIVIEVTEPESAIHDRGDKVVKYIKAGVKEYWIVTPETHTVEQYRLNKNRYDVVAFYHNKSDVFASVVRPDIKFMLSEIFEYDGIKYDHIDGAQYSQFPLPSMMALNCDSNIFLALINWKSSYKGDLAFHHNLAIFYDKTNMNYVVPSFHIADRSLLRAYGTYGVPNLIIEIITFATVSVIHGVKFELYSRIGLPELWIVSPGDKYIAVYVHNGTRLVHRKTYALHSTDDIEYINNDDLDKYSTIIQSVDVPGFAVDIKSIFEDEHIFKELDDELASKW